MRAAGILVFCLFSSILSTVTSLKCQKCFALGTECEEEAVKEEECEEDDGVCAVLVVNNTISTMAVSFTVKECAKREACRDGLFITTIIDDRFELARANCCQTDRCNAEPLHLESYDEFKPNGLQCSGCFALNADSCEAHQTVNCVGDEDQCLSLSSSITAFGNYTEKSTYQGCTRQNLCTHPVGVSEIAGGHIKINVTSLECRNASSSEPNHQ